MTTAPVLAKEYTITYDLNGGSFNGKTDAIVEKIPEGTVISIHAALVKDGYTFLYWKGSEYQPGDPYTVSEDHTFTAQWEKNKKPDSDDNKDKKDKKHKKTPKHTDKKDKTANALILIRRRQR